MGLKGSISLLGKHFPEINVVFSHRKVPHVLRRHAQYLAQSVPPVINSIVGGVGCAACNAQDSRVELYY